MKDIQSQPDHRRINIRKVGVKNISYPITVLDKANTIQKTVASVNMYVNLPHHFKGTHMSRFIEILNRFHGEINLKTFQLILGEMKQRLQAEEAHMEIEFPYFLKQENGESIAVEYRCRMHGSLAAESDLALEINVPVFPPSAAQASGRLPRSLGHWGVARANVRFRHFVWIEDLIRLMESVTSHGLRWPDAKNGPPAPAGLEVETLTRELARRLEAHGDISWFIVTVKNFSEGCNTFASIEWPERPARKPGINSHGQSAHF